MYSSVRVKSRIFYESGLIYCDNFRHCFIACGFKGNPEVLYKFPHVDQANRTITDCLFCYSSYLSQLRPNDDAYRSSLLALTKGNCLLRLDSETGKQLEKIHLSNRTRFRHMSWETDGHSIALKSISYCQKKARGLQGDSETIKFAFMIFDVLPLSFKAHFEIDEQVFPKNIRDAHVGDGLLILELQTNGGTFNVYRLRDIIDNAHPPMIASSEECRAESRYDSCGIPVNVKITELPPLLYTMKCAETDLAFDGYPWHYIVRVVKNTDTFQVRALDAPYAIENGTLEYGGKSVESEGAIFHEDNSGNIVHYSSTEFRVLRLTSTAQRSLAMRTIYTIDFGNESLRESSGRGRFSSSGRRLSRSLRVDDARCDADKYTLISFTYENELDMLATLVADPSSDYCSEAHGSIHIYDNATGSLIKVIALDVSWTEDHEHILAFDCDLLLHIMHRSGTDSRCFIYKLTRPAV